MSTLYIQTSGDITADMISSKLFHTGGSVAARIPTGWMDPTLEVTPIRDSRSGRIHLRQNADAHPERFFEFLREKP